VGLPGWSNSCVRYCLLTFRTKEARWLPRIALSYEAPLSG
jgi:hypothetical protein